ncbi:MAG: O-antigen ligase family protein [Bacteroidales bacterium]
MAVNPQGRSEPPGRPAAERTAFNLDRHVAEVRPRPVASQPAEPAKPELPADTPPAAERRDWAYLGLLAFTFVLFLRPQDLFPPLELLHLAEVFAIVGVVAMVNSRLARRQPVIPMTPEVRGVMVFAGILLALVPFSIWPGGSYAMLTGLFLKVVLIFILMAGTLTRPARLERLVWLMLLASGYLAFRGVFDYARGINLIENGRVAGAVGGVFGNPNDLAMNMVTFLPPALLLAARRDVPPLRRGGAAVIALLMFVTIVFTKSRGGFLGLGAMLLVLMAQGNKIRRGFGAAALVIIIAGLPLLPGSFWERMASITDPSKDETGSRESRQTDMREAWRMFLERPLTGVGPGQMTAYNPTWRQERWREAHNVFLQVAADDGIFGVLAFGYLVVRALRIAWTTSRRARAGPASTDESRRTAFFFSTAMTASLAGWLVCALFASVAYTWTFYYVFGISMGARLVLENAPAPRRIASGSGPRRSIAAA